MSTNPRLHGKVATITGAASGIGESAARLFAANGAFVVIADINDDLGLKVASSIGPDKYCTYKHCDVTDEAQVEAVVAYAVSTYGRLDIMYSNAGLLLGVGGTILDMTKNELEKIMSVNLVGSAFAIKHAARAMIAQGVRGTIVCTASVAAHQGGHASAAYTASKHALLGLVRAAAGDLGKHGIRVNCVSPFMVATGMSTTGTGTAKEVVEGVCTELANLKGMALLPKHIAEAAMFLASEESGFISGQDLVVDGGTSVVYSGISQIMANIGVSNL